LNRNDHVAHRLLAAWELQSGHADRSRELIEQAIRLSPRDPDHWASLHILARAEIATGDCEAALINLRKAIAGNPDAHFVRLYFATALGRMKRYAEARQAIAEFLRASPGLFDNRSDDAKHISTTA
jgi:tetratricopeptide (TPR) repeat protein